LNLHKLFVPLVCSTSKLGLEALERPFHSAGPPSILFIDVPSGWLPNKPLRTTPTTQYHTGGIRDG